MDVGATAEWAESRWEGKNDVDVVITANAFIV